MRRSLGWGIMLLALAGAGCGDDGGSMDAAADVGGSRDAFVPDSGPADAGPRDSGRLDTGLRDTGTVDAGPDATVDAAVDAGPDATVDAAVDAGPDATVDAGPDATVDAGPDATVDAGPDATVDAGPDATVDAGRDATVDAGPDATVDAGPDAAVDAGFDAGTPDTGPADMGPTTCTVAPNSCASGEICLGESCSCIQSMHGNHYLRADGTVVYWANAPVVITVAGGADLDNVTEIFSGSAHGCALRTDDTVWCWPISSLGNRNGQLGNGTTVTNVPTQDLYIANPVMVSPNVPLTAVDHINGGSSRGYAASNSCAVMLNGNLQCWGAPDASGGGGGSLFNDGVAGNRPYAVPILADANNALTGVTAVSIGTRHACVIRNGTTSNEVWCWAANVGGPLGQGDQVGRQFPVQVTLPGPADQMGAGADATCVRIGPSVYCWGSNNSGQVGIGDHTAPANHDGCINYCKLTPAQVVDGNGMPLTDVVDFNMAYLSACAKKSDNTLWCWGRSASATQTDWAIPAVVSTVPVTNVAFHTTSGTSGYGVTLRRLTRDNVLYRGANQVTPLCPPP